MWSIIYWLFSPIKKVHKKQSAQLLILVQHLAEKLNKINQVRKDIAVFVRYYLNDQRLWDIWARIK